MNQGKIQELQDQAIGLLKDLVRIPSFSKDESLTAALLKEFFLSHGVPAQQHLNNIWAANLHFDPVKPSILLNSHHDTVKPNAGYTLDPFEPFEKEGKIFGLGANDAGASLVSLVSAFLYFYGKENLSYNILFAASAEEEISGSGGIESLLTVLPPVDCAIVGEPTGMQMATAERGLMVVDFLSRGKAGHAARSEGVNALYIALDDIQKLRALEFDRISELLGPVQVSVTSIETSNKAHNIVPGECSFIADVRINELYGHEEVLEIIRTAVVSEAMPRSFRLRSTSISNEHPLVVAGSKLGKSSFGSSTSSDKALMPFPALKMGPGDSARSHTADEFIFTSEIRNGISDYIQLLNHLL
jgi:acetylornithine deacetylase